MTIEAKTKSKSIHLPPDALSRMKMLQRTVESTVERKDNIEPDPNVVSRVEASGEGHQDLPQ